MKFTVEEIDVLIISLIRRRNNIQELLKSLVLADSPKSVASYSRELLVVEALLEKVSPGSLKVIRQTEQTA